MKKVVLKITALLFMLTFMIAPSAACSKESYDLVYASWNLSTAQVNNIERKMIKAFEAKTGKKVKIEERVKAGDGYDDSLKVLVGKQETPDVFMLSNLHYGFSNGIVRDISDLVAEDADWASIPGGLEQSVHYGSGVYAVPFAMNMMGFFINEDLFDDYNVDPLGYAPTYAQFESAVKAFAAHKTDGIIGLTEHAQVFEWYAASEDPSLGWFSWDGEKYNLDSQAFKNGIQKTNDLYAGKYSYDSHTKEERETLFSGYDGGIQLWDAGKVAIRWGKTYEIPDMLAKASFNIKFIGVPGGKTPMLGDYVGVSSVTKNPELAYEFAKWMSFDPEGIAKRMELDTEGKEFNTLPLTTDAATINAYFEKNNAVKGLKDVFGTLDDGIVEAVKIVPGYTQSRWKARTGVALGDITNMEIGQLIDQCWQGGATFADYSVNLNKLANDKYKSAIREYEDIFKD